MNAQEKKFRFSLSEDEARKFISFSFKNPEEMLAVLDKSKEEATIRRSEFVEKVNSDSKLLDSFIKNPLDTLKKHKMLDMVRSVSLHYPPELIAAEPPMRLCIEEICVDFRIEMVCLLSEEYMGLTVCREYIYVPICYEWRFRIVPCS